MLKARYWIPLILGLSLILGVICNVAAGSPLHYNIKYGEAATLDFCLYDSNSPWALYETVPATADVNVFRDQGNSESADNAVVDEGPFMSWTISAAEATAKTITLVLKDATAPPAYMDSMIVITTFGHASALHIFDLDSALPTNFSSLVIDTNGTANAELMGIHGVDAAAHNALIVFSTDFATDYNTTTNTWNVNVQTVKNETPEADVVDTLLDVNDNLKTEIAAVQSTADTIEGYTDDISTLQTTMDDANDATAILKTRLPQTLTMAQIGGAGSYYVKVIEPNGLGVMAHGESVSVDVNGIELDANDVMAAVIGELIIQDTNVAVAGTTSSFTVTLGKASADAYAWHLITVTDANDSNKETRLILTYTAGRVVTVNEPFSFTPAAGDIVKIWAIGYFRRARNPLTDPTTY